jgi:hypothetical protein
MSTGASSAELSLPFRLRDRSGNVEIRVEPNLDPEDLGHPLVAIGYDRARFVGFPVIEARIQYDGRGPRAWMGWLQVIERVDDDGTVAMDVDSAPLLGDESPLYTFGYAPTFSDFPANPSHPDGSWHAYAFLVVVPDVVRSKVLEPVIGFHWGYRLLSGRPVEIFRLTPLSLGKWNEMREFLAARHPHWSFTSG